MKRIWVVPTMLTLANGFFGFLALAKCADAARIGGASPLFGDTLEYAAYCVLAAMVCDSLDGWVARRLGTSTELGAQLDSLCDAVTFGIVPGVLFKTFVEGIGDPPSVTESRYFLAAGACYALCAILRLARFNVENLQGREDHKVFRGLPSPGAAIVVVSCVLFYFDERWSSWSWTRSVAPTVRHFIGFGFPFLMCALGILMVSRIAYPHFASALIGRRRSFRSFAQLVVGIALAASEPRVFLFLGSLIFGAFGPAMSLLKRVAGRSQPHSDAIHSKPPAPRP